MAEAVDGDHGGRGMIELFSDPLFWKSFWLTHWQAFLSACLSGVFGIAGGLLYSEQKFLGRRLFWKLSLLCFSLPAILVTLAFASVWGRSGWINALLSGLGFLQSPVSFYGWPLILMAHTFLNFMLFMKATGNALLGMGRMEERAALSLGSGRWRCFWEVTVPKLRPAWRNAFGTAYLFCSTSLIVVLMLGGGPRFTTLEVAVFETVKMDFDLPRAAALGAIQAITGILLFLVLYRKERFVVRDVDRTAFFSLYSVGRMGVVVWILTFVILVGLPLLSLGFGALPGLHFFAHRELWKSLFVSLRLAGPMLLFALTLAFPLAYVCGKVPVLRKPIEVLASLPLAVSTLLLTVGILVSFPSLVVAGRGNVFLIAFVQAVAALPLVFRPLNEGFQRIPVDCIRAARSLGAGAGRVLFQIELPMLKTSLLTASLFAISFSLGEVSAVLVLFTENTVTLPLYLFRLLSRYQFSEAHVAGILLLLLLLGIQQPLARWEADES